MPILFLFIFDLVVYANRHYHYCSYLLLAIWTNLLD